MQDGFDFLVASAQVACRIGVLHVLVMGDTTCQSREQVVAQAFGTDALGELHKPLVVPSSSPISLARSVKVGEAAGSWLWMASSRWRKGGGVTAAAFVASCCSRFSFILVLSC